MLLAFSLQSDIKSIGAYAGFAAIIGLALLVLLYFAHAREMRRMSEWLEQQEERLRSMPARMPQPRPVATTVTPATPATRVVPAQGPAAMPTDVAGAQSATVAVPGVRRVSVGAGGAVVAVAPDASTGETVPPQAATGDTIPPQAPTGEPFTAPLAGAVAAATVAGALIGGGGAVAKPPTDEDATAGAERDAGAASESASADRPAAGLAGDRERDGAAAAEPDAAPDQPGAAVPLTARPPATAEPVGAAQAFGLPAEPVSRIGDAPDTSENAVVAPLDPGSGVVAVAPPEPDAAVPFDAAVGGVAAAESASALVSPFEHTPSAEISAERLPVSPFDFAVHEADVLGAAPEHSAESAEGDAALGVDGAPLAPSTAAGGRPRFPPGPEDARATPVGVSGRAGTAAVGVPLADGTTRRRGGERRPPERFDDDAFHGGRGSVLRLLAAAIVIVAVLIFIATRAFSNGTSSPPSSNSSKTGSSQSAGAPSPSSVTVAVLNGTQTSGLAASAATALAHLGFKKGTVGNALSRGHHTTLVGYTPGNRAAALEVAKDLAPTRTRVGPLDSRTAALTLAQSGLAPTVVVTLGSNYTGG